MFIEVQKVEMSSSLNGLPKTKALRLQFLNFVFCFQKALLCNLYVLTSHEVYLRLTPTDLINSDNNLPFLNKKLHHFATFTFKQHFFNNIVKG